MRTLSSRYLTFPALVLLAMTGVAMAAKTGSPVAPAPLVEPAAPTKAKETVTKAKDTVAKAASTIAKPAVKTPLAPQKPAKTAVAPASLPTVPAAAAPAVTPDKIPADKPTTDKAAVDAAAEKTPAPEGTATAAPVPPPAPAAGAAPAAAAAAATVPAAAAAAAATAKEPAAAAPSGASAFEILQDNGFDTAADGSLSHSWIVKVSFPKEGSALAMKAGHAEVQSFDITPFPPAGKKIELSTKGDVKIIRGPSGQYMVTAKMKTRNPAALRALVLTKFAE